jgi:hypothetical protein
VLRPVRLVLIPVFDPQLYRKWGKKWVDSWEHCKGIGIIEWGCETRYADRTKSWTDSRSELAYSKNKAGFEASVETCSSCSNTSV